MQRKNQGAGAKHGSAGTGYSGLLRAAAVALCAILLCAVFAAVFSLAACAAKAAPEGCSLKMGRPAGKSVFPLDAASWRVSGGYGWRSDPLSEDKEEFHRGIDLACAEGTPVLAAMDGAVASARRSSSYGNCLCIRHAGGWETVYAHMQYIFVRTGEVVRAGQVIGTAGSTGRATGAHLHFELKGQGTCYSPAKVLGV